MDFEVEHLLLAGEYYHKEGSDSDDDAVYRTLVIDGISKSPLDRVDDVVEFLGPKWGRTLRFRGGGKVLRSVVPNWLNENTDAFDRLAHSRLESAADEDLYLIRNLFESLTNKIRERTKSNESTTVGKLLHFYCPHAVLLWDRETVRTLYRKVLDLEGDPDSFVKYHYFGRRLLRHVSKTGNNALEQLVSKHAGVPKYPESLPKIVDELAYSPELALRAVTALGGWTRAFQA